MRRSSQRHSALETAVFAVALLLSAFIARELWHRRFAASPPQAVSRPALPSQPMTPSAHRTEQAVTGVAPIKLTRMQRRKTMPGAVPVPK